MCIQDAGFLEWDQRTGLLNYLVANSASCGTCSRTTDLTFA
ncbi:hypothetical protein ART_3414 [Arthrobacter sp. PAMC 25486]|nr:hypothetical protein ART_3414 [Arthrobacter sp. PAMC 25486]